MNPTKPSTFELGLLTFRKKRPKDGFRAKESFRRGEREFGARKVVRLRRDLSSIRGLIQTIAGDVDAGIGCGI